MEGKPSTSKLVRELIETMPAVKECLSLGIINHSALARLITEELAKGGHFANTTAVKMALIRLGEELKGRKVEFENGIRSVIAGTVISLQSDLTVITASKGAVLPRLREILGVMERARFFQLTQGVDTFVITISREDKDPLLNLLGSGILDIRDEQAAIVLISPENILEKPGIVAFITSVLSFRGINITQVISCHRDTILVVSRKDAPTAYRILEDAILKMRGTDNK